MRIDRSDQRDNSSFHQTSRPASCSCTDSRSGCRHCDGDQRFVDPPVRNNPGLLALAEFCPNDRSMSFIAGSPDQARHLDTAGDRRSLGVLTSPVAISFAMRTFHVRLRKYFKRRMSSCHMADATPNVIDP